MVRDVGQYKIRVTATDSGTPALSASTEFTIRVSSHPHPYQNADLAADVDGDELVAPQDILIVVNGLNRRGS